MTANGQSRTGGSDHEETIHDALRREVYEEALIKAELIETLLDMATLYLELKEVWLLWLVYKIEMDLFTYGAREDANEVVFMNPDVFKDSIYQSGQLV
jgi:8-oxo-dGTP pyrophosphatase MutT (NUDIX family)